MTRRLLTCRDAERAISHELDGLDRASPRSLFAPCDPCERLARSQRAQQSALRALADVSLPNTLGSFQPETRV